MRDVLFGGDFHLHTATRELSYTKTLDLHGLTVGLSAIYDLTRRAPFVGFNVHSTPGVSSSVGSNAVSVHHCVSRQWYDKLVQTDVDVQGSVGLPGTRFNSLTGKLGLQGPIVVDVNAVTVTAIV